MPLPLATGMGIHTVSLTVFVARCLHQACACLRCAPSLHKYCKYRRCAPCLRCTPSLTHTQMRHAPGAVQQVGTLLLLQVYLHKSGACAYGAAYSTSERMWPCLRSDDYLQSTPLPPPQPYPAHNMCLSTFYFVCVLFVHARRFNRSSDAGCSEAGAMSPRHK